MGSKERRTPFGVGADLDNVRDLAACLRDTLAKDDQGQEADTAEQMRAAEAQDVVVYGQAHGYEDLECE
jgi:hypothetical protein